MQHDIDQTTPRTPSLVGPARRNWKRTTIRYASLLAVPYLAVAGLLTIFQRSLIYQPARQAVITTENSLFPPGRVHDIAVPTDDGLMLHGWLVLGRGRTAESLQECDAALAGEHPVVLYFAGNAGNRSYRTVVLTALATSELDILIVDYRGYGDNPGVPHEEALAADARALWRYATEKRGIAADRIILYGESLGGGVATRLAAEVCGDGTPPAGLILQSTFSSLGEVAAYHYPIVPIDWLLTQRFPSADRIGQVVCPILQMHGKRDMIVPFESGRKLFDAAPAESAGGIPKTFVEFPQANHNDVLDIANREFRIAVQEFVQRALPTGTQPLPSNDTNAHADE